jgi:general secretion pathway protein J
LTGVVAMNLQYQDATKEPPVWAGQWTSPDKFPQRLRLGLSTASGAWPELVVAMRLLPGSDPDASGGPSFGVSR